MNTDKKIKLHNAIKKEISLEHPHDHCDICGRELDEPPYMPFLSMKTVCQACFFEWLEQIGVRKE